MALTKSLRHRNEPHAVLGLSCWHSVLIFCLSALSPWWVTASLVLSLYISETMLIPFCELRKWVMRITLENSVACAGLLWLKALPWSQITWVEISTSASFKPCKTTLGDFLCPPGSGPEDGNSRLSLSELWILNQAVPAKHMLHWVLHTW